MDSETTQTLERLLTVKQVADILAISPSKVYQLLSEGQIPAMRIGISVRVAAKIGRAHV